MLKHTWVTGELGPQGYADCLPICCPHVFSICDVGSRGLQLGKTAKSGQAEQKER